MLSRLRTKWKVSTGRLVLILITFAVGGSLTGYLGRKLLGFLGVHNTVLFIIAYIILITLLWPVMVLVISVPLGQFSFFLNYLRKIGRRMSGKTQPSSKVNIAVFASGAGSNARKLIEHFEKSASARIALIVCNKPGAGVLSIAQDNKIPTLLVEREKFFRGDSYLPELHRYHIQFIVLAGFLWKVPDALISAYPRKIINLHPALLPKFGGKGMYGHHVHTAALASGDQQSGITIHYVDEHYDNGDIIFQAPCPIEPGDTPETLASRIHELEHSYLPEVVERVLEKQEQKQ